MSSRAIPGAQTSCPRRPSGCPTTGAATSVQFEPTALGLLNLHLSGPTIPLMSEIEKLRGLHILCFYGSDEKDSICSSMDPKLAQCVELQGGHHFGGDFTTIGRRIVAELSADTR